MIIQSVVQNAISRARRRKRANGAPLRTRPTSTIEGAETPKFRPSSRREDLGVMVVVVLFVAFIIGFFVAG